MHGDMWNQKIRILSYSHTHKLSLSFYVGVLSWICWFSEGLERARTQLSFAVKNVDSDSVLKKLERYYDGVLNLNISTKMCVCSLLCLLLSQYSNIASSKYWKMGNQRFQHQISMKITETTTAITSLLHTKFHRNLVMESLISRFQYFRTCDISILIN